jgi:tetratricopeptide (TPR) repeat protein
MANSWGTVLALAACLGLAMPPRAAMAGETLDRYIIEAVRLYEGLDYELALEQLGLARTASPSDDEEAVISLYEGIIRADLGRWEEARASFQSALQRKPEAQLPLRVSPKVKREFEAVRANVRAQLASRPPKPDGSGTEAQAAELPLAIEPPTSLAPTQPAHSSADGASAQPALVPSSTEARATEVRERRTPVVPWVLLGVGVAAGGTGTWFGLSSRGQSGDAREARYQDELLSHHAQAKRDARTANILFGTAGLAAAGALVTWLLSPSPAGEPVSELAARGGAR